MLRNEENYVLEGGKCVEIMRVVFNWEIKGSPV